MEKENIRHTNYAENQLNDRDKHLHFKTSLMLPEVVSSIFCLYDNIFEDSGAPSETDAELCINGSCSIATFKFGGEKSLWYPSHLYGGPLMMSTKIMTSSEV